MVIKLILIYINEFINKNLFYFKKIKIKFYSISVHYLAKKIS
jgi:hypothetical protein